MKPMFGLTALIGALSCCLSQVVMAPLYGESPIVMETPTPITFDGPTVRVLIAHGSKGALLEVAGRYVMVDPKTNKKIDAGFLGERLTVHPTSDGVLWSNHVRGIYQFKLAPRTGERLFWLDGVQYTGVLYVYQIGQNISFVNEMTIEDYVAAVVEANTDASILPQAANALAICARSDAWYHTKTRRDNYWQVYAPEVNFRGIGGITKSSRGSVAAKATEGLYITHANFNQNSGLFMSRWTAHSGGRTISYNYFEPERKEDGDFGVEAPLAQLDRQHTQWQTILTQEEIEKAFDLPEGSLLDVGTLRDTKTQKVSALLFKTKGEPKQFGYFRVVQVLGVSKIQSSDFTIQSIAGHQFQVTGYGRGDGVGLCIYSCEKMAEQGRLAPEILQSFFPGSKVELLKME